MAKLKIGALITGASGSLGGHTIGKNKGTYILQNKSVSKQPPTSAQTEQRSNTDYLMKLFKTLTPFARINFQLLAEYYSKYDVFGDNINYTAFGIFQKLQQGFLQIGLSPDLNPTDVDTPNPPKQLPVVASTTAITIQSDYLKATDYIVIYASRALSKGTSNPRKYMRKVAVATASQLSTGINIITNYEQIFGTPLINTNVFFGFKTYSGLSGFSNGELIINDNATIIADNSDSLILSGIISYYTPDSIDATATVTGDLINVWNDTINSNNAVQTGSLRPLLRIASNGERQVNFNGTGRFLNLGNPAAFNYIAGVEEFTIIVILGEQFNADGYFVSKAPAASANRLWGIAFFAPQYSVFRGGTEVKSVNATATPNDLLINSIGVNSISLIVNNTTVINQTGGLLTNSTTQDANIGGRTNGSLIFRGQISRIAFYNRVLNASEISAIQAQYIIP